MKIILYGEPQCKQGAKAGNGRFYQPKSQVAKTEKLKLISHLKDKEFKMLKGAVSIDYVFYLKKSKREKEGQLALKKPDLDNMQKFYNDVLEKILFENDKNVVKTSALKLVSETPRTEIVVNPVSGEKKLENG